MKIRLIRAYCVATALLISAWTGPQASAEVSGSMNIANDAGGGVILSLPLIDFAQPVGGGIGSFTTGLGTLVLSSAGNVTSGISGFIKDIPLGGGIIPDFISFPVFPDLHFDLTSLGPGVANTIAPNTFNPNDPASSPIAGSPLVLRPTATGTEISFTAGGLAHDGVPADSNWTGLFTTQVIGQTPFQVQQALLNPEGAVASTYSASFAVTVIPEPATWMLLTGGLVCGWAIGRRFSYNR